MQKKTFIWSLITVVVLLISTALFITVNKPENRLSSVQQSSEYHNVSLPVGAPSTSTLLQAGPAVLGSVIINTTTFGNFTLYDWDGTTSTVSTTLTAFISGATQGTYTYDIIAPHGLWMITDTSTGMLTVTYR